MTHIIRSKFDLKKVINRLKSKNISIGLVPTMGALHQGHLSLVQLSKRQYDATIATIFVNPTQFNNKEDLQKYPKTEVSDIALLTQISCDYIFIPTANEMYSKEPSLQLSFGYLENILEGKHRPSHFNGVGLIIMKLFGLIKPTGAYFGQKDLQQFRVISAIVRDFELPINLHLAPIIREKSGLAMSSRNRRLSKKDKLDASKIYVALQQASLQLHQGLSIKEVMLNTTRFLNGEDGIKLEYFEIVDAETLQENVSLNDGDQLALCAAAYVAGVRLIDNIIIDL